MSASVKPKLLVIGAGFAGTALAAGLAKTFDVTLVDKNEYLEVYFANARTLVEPAAVDKTLLPVADMTFAKEVKFITAEVTSLTDKSATLTDGRVLDFAYCAICTGADVPFGKGSTPSVAARKAELHALAQRIATARSVVIVGGGATGVEVAGEIATDQPGKELTLVHSGDRLLPGLSPKLGANAYAWLKAHGVRVLLGQRLDVEALKREGQAVTSAGEHVKAEETIVATGVRPATSFMKAALADTLDPATGAIKVDKHLRVIGHNNLFALGDATDVPENKLAFLAKQHALLTTKNLLAILQRGPSAKLGTWKPNMGIMMAMISVGRSYGVAQVGCITCGGFFPTKMKSQGVISTFTTMYRKELLAAGA